MKKQFITIAGKLGSGKSSTAKKLAQELGYEHHSTGQIMREIAREHGFDLTEWNLQAEKDPRYDYEIDDRTKELGKKEKIVMDSRLAFHFVPDSFKVYLNIDGRVAAQRIYESLSHDESRAEEFKATSVEEMAQDITVRRESEVKRYQNLYGIDNHALENFDLVIDTGKPENDLASVTAQVKKAYLAWLGA